MRLLPLSFVVLLALAGTGAQAQPATPVELKLDALGGARLEVPAGLKEVRKDPGIVVLEQAPEPAQQKPFYVLLVAIEEGPPKDAPIPWAKVRDNIVEAASKNGRKLELVVGDPFTAVPGFDGLRLQGSFEAAAQGDKPARKVAIDLIALVRDGKLVTVGLVSEAPSTKTSKDLVDAIAKTTKLGAP